MIVIVEGGGCQPPAFSINCIVIIIKVKIEFLIEIVIEIVIIMIVLIVLVGVIVIIIIIIVINGGIECGGVVVLCTTTVELILFVIVKWCWYCGNGLKIGLWCFYCFVAAVAGGAPIVVVIIQQQNSKLKVMLYSILYIYTFLCFFCFLVVDNFVVFLFFLQVM